MTETRDRPQSLRSVTHRLRTEHGNLFITVSLDGDGCPFEVFGALGKCGSFSSGVTELVCRLVSLYLRRGTPLEEIVSRSRESPRCSLGPTSLTTEPQSPCGAWATTSGTSCRVSSRTRLM